MTTTPTPLTRYRDLRDHYTALFSGDIDQLRTALATEPTYVDLTLAGEGPTG